ncbi:MAG: Gfo/Idh/MocA family oxidoreductase [Clostridia bacterium]|nr:Gfo/Idh/MocA family oxidoreductase [Clostridia bacterium]
MTHIAILGCGSIAYSMAETLRKMKARGDDLCLYAAASRSIDKAKDFAASEGFEKAYTYEDMLADPKVDLVYIASPHSHHALHMKMCLEAGKAVLCEKAFTANAQQAREVLALAKEKNILVAEAIWTRYMPSRKILLDLIADGVIGKPQLLTSNLFYPIENIERIRQPELAGGALLDVGVYPLNFASMMFGNDFVRMESSVELMKTGVDRQESITLFYGDGRMAQLWAGTTCRSDRRCVISGTDGYIVVDNVNNPLVIEVYEKKENFALTRRIDVPKQLTGYEYQVESCLRALARGEIECPEMPHSESIMIMDIMDALRAQWGVKYPFED